MEMKNLVLLIQPSFKFRFLDVPLGLLYLGTYLKSAGLDVSLVDGSEKDLRRQLQRKPPVIGIYATTLHINTVLHYIGLIRRMTPASKIIIGGPHASISPEFFMDKADAVIVGEAEESFLAYIKEIRKKQPVLSKVDGLVYRKGKRIIHNPKSRFSDLSKIPLPDFSLIDIKSHIQRWPYFDYLRGVRGISLVTSRGCPFDCSYCQPITRNMFGKRIRQHPAGQIIAKMEEVKSIYGIDSFFFHDDTFTWNRRWVEEFCAGLIARKVDVNWICNTRIDMVDYPLLRKLADAGLKEIRFGIESVNVSAQTFYNKKISPKKIRESIDHAKAAGLKTFGFFMIGAPMESEDDIWKTIRFAIRSKLDFARFSILVNMPGTHMSAALAETYATPEGFDYIKDSRNNCSPIPYRRLERIRKSAHLLFYFHPKRIGRTIRSLFSVRGLLAKIERF